MTHPRSEPAIFTALDAVCRQVCTQLCDGHIERSTDGLMLRPPVCHR